MICLWVNYMKSRLSFVFCAIFSSPFSLFGLRSPVSHTKYQGSDKVCFVNADPIFVRRFLILDSKSVTNVGSRSNKYCIQPDSWSLQMLLIPILWSDLRAVIPEPSLVIPNPTPLIPDTIYFVTTLKYSIKVIGKTVTFALQLNNRLTTANLNTILKKSLQCNQNNCL